MKTFSFVLLYLLCAVFTADAQPFATDSVKRVELGKAFYYIGRLSSPSFQQEAYSSFSKYASLGDVSCMYQLYRCFLNGWGVEKSPLKGLEWLEKAAVLGHEGSLIRLVDIYKQGLHGVPQNLTKAFEYASCLSERGSPIGCYQVGYLLYKGLGCRQNYSEAMRYFEKGALAGHGASMYMLGLGYRNGYGVAVDLVKAKELLIAAADKGVPAAQLELETATSENIPNAASSRSISSVGASPGLYPRICHQVTDNLSGCYSGTLYTYDWSGEHVIDRKTLSLEVAVSGDEVTMHWMEAGEESVMLCGISSDTLLLFNQAGYWKSDRYAPSKSLSREFVSSRLSVTSVGGKTTLCGTVEQCSPEVMEPERPMYFAAAKHSELPLNGAGGSAVAFTASPNPFADVVCISFTLSQPESCRLLLYSSTGVVVFDQLLGSLLQGRHSFNIRPDVAAGTYILKLAYGSHSCVSTLVKELK